MPNNFKHTVKLLTGRNKHIDSHTINLTQIFLANQLWKNPHGENQSERGESLYYFLQQKNQTLNLQSNIPTYLNPEFDRQQTVSISVHEQHLDF